jgi:putative membrane protein
MKRLIQLAGLELRRFRTPLQRAGLAFAVAVPLLYGAIYLWTNWDPYGRLNQIPVAVVNLDKPVTVQGHEVNAGQLFVDQLHEQPLLGWRFVDAAEAAQGQRDGRYYLVITVPEDFSAKLTSGVTGSPQRAAMEIRLDDANGFIIGKMAETVQSELERQISAAAVGAYFQAAFGGLDTFTNGLTTAAVGADAAHSGATQLSDGIGKLHNGSGQLVTGSRQVADGIHQLNLIAGPLLNSTAQALPRMAQTAGDISSTAKQVTATAATGTEALAKTATKVSDDLTAFAARHPDITSDPLFQAAQQATTKVSQDATSVADLAGRIDTLAGQVSADVTKLQQDTPGLQNKLTTASADLSKLDAGATQVADGTVTLDKGLADAATGSGQLASGTGQLAGGLRDAQSKVPTLDAKQRATFAETLSSPVQVTLSNLHPATVYGRGLAPFFFGIALWVFGIVAFLLLRPISTRLLAGRTWPATAAFAAWLPVFAVGLAGALLLFLVVNFGLGLHPVDGLGTIGIIALAVAAFTAIVHVLRLAFGAVGDALALVLLMIQLTSCGGLYPPETLPAPFKAIHPVLPMTHLVDALRVTVSGGQSSHLWRAVAVLAGYLAVALALLVWTAGRQRIWTMGRLKPELSL